MLAACAPTTDVVEPAAPAAPSTSPSDAALSPAPTPAGATIRLALVGDGSAAAQQVADGAQQVVGANAVSLDVVAAVADVTAKAQGLILVGPAADALAAAQALEAKVVVVGPAPGEADAVLGSDAELAMLTEAQAVELGRASVETAASLVEGQGGLKPQRTLADVMQPR
ncbi:MAG TPA: hypothetical protein DCZ72_04805 [Armatimonadetes bacterium]|nr:hypothetical protein [Armatimonadota bacterium]